MHEAFKGQVERSGTECFSLLRGQCVSNTRDAIFELRFSWITAHTLMLQSYTHLTRNKSHCNKCDGMNLYRRNAQNCQLQIFVCVKHSQTLFAGSTHSELGINHQEPLRNKQPLGRSQRYLLLDNGGSRYWTFLKQINLQLFFRRRQ